MLDFYLFIVSFRSKSAPLFVKANFSFDVGNFPGGTSQKAFIFGTESSCPNFSYRFSSDFMSVTISEVSIFFVPFPLNSTTVSPYIYNYTKFKVVIFEKRAKVYGNFELDEQIIAACVSYKYLGIYFDRKLNFDIHIGRVVEKLSKQCGIVYKLRETLNTSHLLAYIRAYVSPTVQYGVLLYGFGRKTMLQQILVIQKKLVRMAFRLP